MPGKLRPERVWPSGFSLRLQSCIPSFIPSSLWGVGAGISHCAAGRALTERSISFQAGFPFSRPFWASQVQGKGEAPGSSRQLGHEEEEERGECRGGRWAGQWGLGCHSPMPQVSVGCFLWGADTQPLLGRGHLPPLLCGGGSCFQGAPQVLALISISRTPLGPS